MHSYVSWKLMCTWLKTFILQKTSRRNVLCLGQVLTDKCLSLILLIWVLTHPYLPNANDLHWLLLSSNYIMVHSCNRQTDRQTRDKRNRHGGWPEIVEQGNKNSPALSSTNLIMNNILHAPVQYRMVSSEACRKGSAGPQGHVNTYCHHPLANWSPLKHNIHWPGNTEKAER